MSVSSALQLSNIYAAILHFSRSTDAAIQSYLQWVQQQNEDQLNVGGIKKRKKDIAKLWVS